MIFSYILSFEIVIFKMNINNFKNERKYDRKQEDLGVNLLKNLQDPLNTGWLDENGDGKELSHAQSLDSLGTHLQYTVTALVGDGTHRLHTRAVQIALELARLDEQVVAYVALHLLARLIEIVVATVHLAVFARPCRVLTVVIVLETSLLVRNQARSKKNKKQQKTSQLTRHTAAESVREVVDQIVAQAVFHWT